MTNPTSPAPMPAPPAPQVLDVVPPPDRAAAPQAAAQILAPRPAPQLPAQVRQAPPAYAPQPAPAPGYAPPIQGYAPRQAQAQVRPAGALVTYGQGARPAQAQPAGPMGGVGEFVRTNQREIVAAGIGALAFSLLRGGRFPGGGRGGHGG